MRRPGLYRQFEKLTKAFLSLGRKTYGDTIPPEFISFPFHRLLTSFKAESVYRDTANKLNNIQAIADHLNKLVGVNGSQARVDEVGIIERFLSEILGEENNWSFKKSKFNKIYSEMEDFFFNKNFWFRIYSPLFGFQMNMKRHEFAPKVVIRKTTDKEKIHFRNYYPAPLWVEHVMEHRVPFNKIIGDSKGNKNNNPSILGEQIFSSVCSSLRLMHGGFVAQGGVWSSPLFFNPTEMGTIIRNPSFPAQWWGKYNYSPSQHSTVLRYYNYLMDFDYGKELGFATALRRFNYGYEKNRVDEKLIDYIISFEALLLHDTTGELQYRLALRTAHTLGRYKEHKKYYF